jgi:hypothetical protein
MANKKLLLKNLMVVVFTSILLMLPYPAELKAGSINKSKTNIETINFTVIVTEIKTHIPLQLVNVILKRNNSIIAAATTNPFGRAAFMDIQSSKYELSTRFIGYNDYLDTITVDSLHRSYNIELSEKNLELGEIEVKGTRENKVPTTIDITTGRQTLEGESYHAAPTGKMTDLIQQNLTGEIHIRGQHGEFSYLVDGIPIPLGVFGGLNEIVDPKVVSRVTFYTGGFPAEFGGQISGIMDIQNRVPTGKFHLDYSTFAGSYLTPSTDSSGSKVGNFKDINSNGQSLSFSDHLGKLGFFFAGSRQESDRRIDQPVIPLFHDHGFDYFGFGKFDYLLNQNDYITADLNYSTSLSQIPYDPSLGYLNDIQNSYNGFQTLSFFHTISSVPDKESNFFFGGFAREGGLQYNPDVNDYQKVYLNGDSSKSYVVKQDRHFTTLGFRTKYDQELSHHFRYSAGVNYSYTTGTENFTFLNQNNENQFNNSAYTGYDFGAFAQTGWHPEEWTRIDMGLRYDVHNAPGIPNQSQISPRFKWSFFLDESNSLVISYDRLFMPTNIENLGALASLFGNIAPPALAEKDNLYEIDFIRNWGEGFNTKLDGFYKLASPGLDDQTLGSSTVRVNVNIDKINTTGIELALTYNNPENPLSGYINGSIIHAYGTGPVTGGFLPPDSSTNVFDLDHDQRLSGVVGLNYQANDWYINLTSIYSSGLTNGNSISNFKTGLFDFNTSAHTTPSWVLNLAGGYTFNLGNGI